MTTRLVDQVQELFDRVDRLEKLFPVSEAEPSPLSIALLASSAGQSEQDLVRDATTVFLAHFTEKVGSVQDKVGAGYRAALPHFKLAFGKSAAIDKAKRDVLLQKIKAIHQILVEVRDAMPPSHSSNNVRLGTALNYLQQLRQGIE